MQRRAVLLLVLLLLLAIFYFSVARQSVPRITERQKEQTEMLEHLDERVLQPHGNVQGEEEEKAGG
jgi:preprotein translocase subunit YajC